ncbi:MAG TPA: class I SAM-dependent methyltransferase, partial [Flavobacteriales bacterium]|nr:class I SAM-dependent methyltransferase [Flavobacteriales bacterium]
YVDKGRVLDVGCGNGNFLRIAKVKGWDTYGIDPNFYNSEESSKYAKVTFGTLKDGKYDENFFDLITCHSTFVYITNPLDFLIEAKRIMKPGGIFFITPIPNISSIDAKFNIYNLLSSYPPGRVSYFFSKKTISAIVLKAGLEILDYKALGTGRFLMNKRNILENSDTLNYNIKKSSKKKPLIEGKKSKNLGRFIKYLRSTNFFQQSNILSTSFSLLLTKK